MPSILPQSSSTKCVSSARGAARFRAIAALAAHEIDVTPLIGKIYPLDDADVAFQAAAAKGAKKIILRVDRAEAP